MRSFDVCTEVILEGYLEVNALQGRIGPYSQVHFGFERVLLSNYRALTIRTADEGEFDGCIRKKGTYKKLSLDAIVEELYEGVKCNKKDVDATIVDGAR